MCVNASRQRRQIRSELVHPRVQCLAIERHAKSIAQR
jgi:hypothetical protein